MTSTLHTTDHEGAALSKLLRSPDFQTWRAQVTATRGCAAPIHLDGSSRVLDRDGAVLTEREGRILAPCGNRRASVCAACSDRYASDAYHLVRPGMAGGTKGVPETVATHPRAFVTLTAPSFGPVHSRRLSARARVVPCGCGEKHREHDTRLGTPIDPDGYDYTGAVLWQAHAGALWNRFVIALRRALAGMLGVRVRDFRDYARLSYAKVAEYQRRGMVHFHAVVRLDGPDGPTTAPPTGVNAEGLNAAIRAAVDTAALVVARPDGDALTLAWGRQVDIRPITPAARDQLEDRATGEITDAALAAYVAKYATKGTGKSEATDRPIRDIAHVAHLNISDHHRRMIETAWQLGGLEAYDGLNLRRWAHMLGFRGHFLTKSRAYSTTFRAIRGERRVWRLVETLREIDRDTDDPNDIAPDLTTITVVNDWSVVHIGHHNDAERDVAQGISERFRAQRTTGAGRAT
ncbi:replication initiator [Pseudonocardia endophytica]|uniref:Replication initiation protein n=1 Tax=Pseudonocardia endophytica TaxID=401976 RepID=A0A4R1HWK5_PSEEN|nr:replication initiator [Pseudonocardia endophytica]TCK27117.1 hypothetical protein EV378_2975 [Pseudonocardia endophytica]